MEDRVVIELRNVNKTFTIRDKANDSIREKIFHLFDSNKKRKIHALKNINLEIKQGEFVGVIGRNGSGKSTLLQIMTGSFPPDRGGEAKINGKFVRLSLGMGFNKELTARENIYINASIIGLSLKKIGRVFQEIVDFAELEDFVDTKIKYFSRGMRSRLAFAIAIHSKADIILMDEFFGGVGDEKFRQKSDEVFKQTFLNGQTIVHVSHNLQTIRKYCDRVILMNKGVCELIDKPDIVIEKYKSIIDES
ncbi:MAG: ATP-binding cassette domain-containing protein [Bacteroidales bacterium]|nr:ATP-binding cassette domain-containing protein [Bacteroidales bacterium]